ncbi:MAG TPA: hypothetical protein VFW86_00935 [Candidatus Limnocylindrales bacterium]|nr:hypothetical protein [Candidatus Limnocylindrales bacterium]
MPTEPTPAEHALRAVSDSFLARVSRLVEIEQEKRQLAPDDPNRTALSREVEELSQQILADSVRQDELASAAAEEAEVGAGGRPGLSIEDTEPRPLHQILEAWRDAERRAEAAQPGTEEAEGIAAEIRRLRLEYSRAYATAQQREARPTDS